MIGSKCHLLKITIRLAKRAHQKVGREGENKRTKKRQNHNKEKDEDMIWTKIDAIQVNPSPEYDQKESELWTSTQVTYLNSRNFCVCYTDV